MQLVQNLYDQFYEKAKQVTIAHLAIGLRYTVVTTDDGGMGLAYTYEGEDHFGPRQREYRDFENRPAIELLDYVTDPIPLRRSMGLALVNALNHSNAYTLPEDASDSGWMDVLHIGEGARVAMVGFFRPLMQKLDRRGAVVEVLDKGQGVGEKTAFYQKLATWADALVLTSTSILNNTTEEILEQLRPGVKAVMLGPSTPMVPQAFTHLPVSMLAGTLPVDQAAVLKAIRHGCGTPVVHRHSRKVVTPV